MFALRQVFLFLTGLTLAIVFAMSAMVAVGCSVVFVKDLAASRGDMGVFEARVRHYTDCFEPGADPMSLRMHEASHPILQFVVVIAISFGIAIGSARMIDRVSRAFYKPPA